MLLVVIMVFTSLATPVFAQFSGGNGIQGDPYQVANVLHLWNVREYLSSYFIQTADIDLGITDPEKVGVWSSVTSYRVGDFVKYTPNSTQYTYICIQATSSVSPTNASFWKQLWESSKGWDPIGDQVGTGENTDISKAFTGQYNGSGKLVYNLYINRGAATCSNDEYPSDGEDNVGLFGFLTNTNAKHTEIKKLGLINPRVTGRRGTGSLVGKILNPYRNPKYSNSVYISECYAIPDGSNTAYVKGFGATGGLVGANNSDRKQQVPYIRFSYAKIPVSATHPYNSKGNPSDAFGNNPSIQNPYNIKYGGLVGCNENGVTHDSYAWGHVSGGDRVGGLAGCTIDGAIIRCYAMGTVTRNIQPGSSLPNYEGGVGGLVGRVDGSLPPGLGGTQGQGSVQNSYWNTTTSGTSSSPEGIGYSDAQMKVQGNFANWDFTNVWTISAGSNNGYPHLTNAPRADFYYKSIDYSDTTTDGWSNINCWTIADSPTGSYSAAITYPGLSNSFGIQVDSDIYLHQMNLDADQMVINSGKMLTIGTGNRLSVVNGLNPDMDLTNNGSIVIEDKVGSGAFGKLEIGTSASLENNGSITVKGELVNHGTITSGTNSTITFSGTVQQSFSNPAAGYLQNVVVNNPQGLVFSSSVVINGVLQVDSGSVSGTVATDGYTSATLNYLEIVENGANINNFAAATSIWDGSSTRIKRQWTVNGTFAGSKTVKVYWSASDDNGMDWTGQTPALYIGATKYVASSYNVGDTYPRWLSVDVTGFGDTKGVWQVGNSTDETLPVELSSFTATISQNNKVQLYWVTQSETNVSGFRIYRGLVNDAAAALQLSVFIPATNSSQAQHYLYEDTELFESGYYYYWLESNDLEGSSELFGPVSVNFGTGDSPNIPVPLVNGINSIYPNPFNPFTTISFSMEKDAPVEINIYNQKGQMVRSLAASSMTKGNHRLGWDGRDDNGKSVSSGIYLMKLKLGSELFSRKLTLQK